VNFLIYKTLTNNKIIGQILVVALGIRWSALPEFNILELAS